MRVFCLPGRVQSMRRAALSLMGSGGLLVGLSMFAQEAPNAPTPQPASTAPGSRGETFGGVNYANGARILHQGPLAPFKAHHVAAPNLSNSPRMDQLVRDGKVY